MRFLPQHPQGGIGCVAINIGLACRPCIDARVDPPPVANLGPHPQRRLADRHGDDKVSTTVGIARHVWRSRDRHRGFLDDVINRRRIDPPSDDAANDPQHAVAKNIAQNVRWVRVTTRFGRIGRGRRRGHQRLSCHEANTPATISNKSQRKVLDKMGRGPSMFHRILTQPTRAALSPRPRHRCMPMIPRPH